MIISFILGIVIAVPVVLLAALNTDPGRRLAERAVAAVSGEQVIVEGLSGRFPDAPRVALITLRDAHGRWAEVHDASLDWAPLDLARGVVKVRRLAATAIALDRLPPSSGGGGTPSGTSFGWRVDVLALRVDRVSLGKAVLGEPAAFAVDGAATLTSSEDGNVTLTLQRLDGSGSYAAEGKFTQRGLSARVTAREPPNGFAASLAGARNLGAITLNAQLDGPWSQAATRLTLSAGALHAEVKGHLDVRSRGGDLRITASAPAMAPRADLAWTSVAVDVRVWGTLTHPDARGMLRVTGLRAAGASAERVAADVSDSAGHAKIHASIDGVKVPGPKPDLLATAPITLDAEARTDSAGFPTTFALTHPLIALQGETDSAGGLRAKAHVVLPDLAAIATAAGLDATGRAEFDLSASQSDGATTVDATGTVGILGGQVPLPALIGPAAKLDAGIRLTGSEITLSHLAVDGKSLSLRSQGKLADGRLQLDWQSTLSDLSALAPTIHGTAVAGGKVDGLTENFALDASVTANVGLTGADRQPIRLTLAGRGLPNKPEATVTVEGSLDSAPVALAIAAERAADGTLSISVERGGWKSAHAEGTLRLSPNAVWPTGELSLGIDKLRDLQGLLGRPIAGRLTAHLDASDQNGHSALRIDSNLQDATLAPALTIQQAKLSGSVLDPLTDPNVDGKLDLVGVRASGTEIAARLSAKGREPALSLKLVSTAQGVAAGPMKADADAILDAHGRSVVITSMQANLAGASVRLRGPARIDFADGLAIDRLNLALQRATLEVAGRVLPTLELSASLRDLTPDALRSLVPDLDADGTVSAEARLRGTLTRPSGTVHLAASGFRSRVDPLRGLPAASLNADITLNGTAATLRLRLAAGSNTITVDGQVPIPGATPPNALRLHGNGILNLATINPLIGGGGQRVRGTARLDTVITGSISAPEVAGSVRLTGGDVEDFGSGAHLTDVTARVDGAGHKLQLSDLSARAGQGTIHVRGDVGLSGSMPIDLTIAARNATPLSSDRLTATFDSDLTLRGDLQGPLAVDGTVKVTRADFRIPERLPAIIPVLQVRRPDQPAPAPAPAPPPVALDVTVIAPGQIFIRGRGVFAELAGRVHISGTTVAPVPDGPFRLKRGSVSLAGRNLEFTSGTIRFEGSSTLDPALNLVATSSNGNITATLTIGGFASAPKITLSSVPELPQDEVLAQLLFRQSAGSLSPLQLAEIAASLAQLSGLGGGAFDPLNRVRQELGLDRLNVGGSASGSGAAVEAGRYLAPGVYLGARQATSGAGTQATVQIDLLRGLKLETSVGTGMQTSATGGAGGTDPYGTSVGLTYQFQY
ncbi:MAG: translocation/assembly module TamB domain-containing protein [Alphaproteobacteria bacterium]|nr:translocation/assembly module TamB domain-containing protein [Alphaproteobacteria bacterium]